MRLLHIMASRGLGGAETYSVDMMLSLHGAGIDQCVVVSKHAPEYNKLVDAGIRTAPEVLSLPLRFAQRFLLGRLIKHENPDVIHCWMRRAASLLPKKDKLEGKTVIGWFGGYYNPAKFSRCTDFIGVTMDIVSHMVKQGVPEDCANFIPTFPDIEPMPPVNRKDFDTPKNAPVLLALSRLHPKKGLDTLLRAVKSVPDAFLWLAGDGPLKNSLEAMADDLGLKDRVRFLGWRDDRSALLAAADICVLPSRYEPFGTVILEAWATKTPFVACASAGPAAHVEDGVNGLLVPIDDVDALAKALGRVINDKKLRQKLIEGGYKSYAEAYTREVVTEKMIALYNKMIKKNNKPEYSVNARA